MSGTIEWGGWREVVNPYLTIAGETAPGDGILIRAGLVISTHDVIIRHMQFRAGYETSKGEETLSGPLAMVGSPSSPISDNIIVDHCSFTWHKDDFGWGCSNCTMQRSIVANALFGLHGSEGWPKLGIVGGYYGISAKVSILHSLLANTHGRAPNVCEGELQFINNVIFNVCNLGGDGANHGWACGTHIYFFMGPVKADLINNYYAEGSNISPYNANSKGALTHFDKNYFVSQDTDGDMSDPGDFHSGDIGFSKSSTPLFSSIDSILDIKLVRDDVLQNVGAMLPIRSGIDEEIIKDVEEKRTGQSGSYKPGEANLGQTYADYRLLSRGRTDYPNIPFTQRPANYDTDRDGIPNEWEEDQGLDPNDASDGAIITADGYSNLEHYLHSLSGTLFTPDNPDSTPPKAPEGLRFP